MLTQEELPDSDSDNVSTSLPFPFGTMVLLWETLGEGDGEVLLIPAPASCHAGILGFGMTGVGKPPEVLGPRLSNKAFSDFNSCCNSAMDCV